VATGANATLVSGGNRSMHVGGDRVDSVAKNATAVVHGDSFAEVRGVSVHETARDDMHVVRGDASTIVYGRHALHVASKKDGVKGASTTYVDGALIQTATDRVLLRAEQPDNKADSSTLRLECGDTVVELSKDTVKLTAKNVLIEAAETFVVNTKKATINGSDSAELQRGGAKTGVSDKGFSVKGVDKVELQTDKSKLSLDSGKILLNGSDSVDLKSSAIKMGTGSTSDSASASSSSSSTTPPTKDLSVAFVHPLEGKEDEPIKNTRYRLTAGDFVKEADTGGGGTVSASIPPDAKQVQVILFVDETGDYKHRYAAPLVFDLQVEDDLHSASDAQGALMRLRNLGYTPGTDLTVKDLKDDPLTRKALETFQRDSKIRISGKLDEDDTGTTLDKTYGGVS
jgi:hypothetical protein